MQAIRSAALLVVLASSPVLAFAGRPVDTTAALVAAVRDGAEGATIEIAEGTFELDAPLEPKARMTLKGAGMAKTVITNAAGWKPSTKTLPDPEMTTKGMDTNAYLIRLKDKAAGITISDLTLHGPQVHGAIYGWEPHDLHLHHVRIKETLWAGVRTFGMKKAKIHDCEFIDAGGRWEKGEPGVKGGITGGAIFAIWMGDCEIFDNRFVRTRKGKARGVLRHQGAAGAAVPRPPQHDRSELLDGVPVRERRGHRDRPQRLPRHHLHPEVRRRGGAEERPHVPHPPQLDEGQLLHRVRPQRSGDRPQPVSTSTVARTTATSFPRSATQRPRGRPASTTTSSATQVAG